MTNTNLYPSTPTSQGGEPKPNCSDPVGVRDCLEFDHAPKIVKK